MQGKFQGSLIEVVYDCCAGIDVHSETIKVCLLKGRGKRIREYGTMTGELLECIEWLKEEKCEMVLMESTGSYWKPLYNLFEAEEMAVKVANAASVKAIAKQKTDVKDAEWLATLVRYDLVKASYIPTRDQRELREMVRYRKSIVEERVREVNRIHKVLEGANIKLGNVVANIQGESAMAMLRMIATGETDPVLLSLLAKGKLKEKIPKLQEALRGSLGTHQQNMLCLQLEHYDALTRVIAALDRDIKKN